MAANSQLGVATAVLDVDVTRALSAVNKFVSAMGSVNKAVAGVGDTAGSAEKKMNGLNRFMRSFASNAWSEIAGSIGTNIFGRIVGGITSVVGASAQFETLKTRLEVATGSSERMDRVWKDLGAFAAKTPFELPELVETAAQLESMGLDSMKWTKTMGEVSSGTGKNINDVSRAFIAAQFGEYESMKQLGVSMKRDGENLVISYYENGKKISKTVDASNQEVINSTLEAMWNDRYAGSMEKQSNTWAGMMSTIKDNISMLAIEAFEGVFNRLKGVQKAIIGFFDAFAEGRKELSLFKALMVALDETIEAALGREWANAIIGGIKVIAILADLIKLLVTDVLKLGKAIYDEVAPALKLVGPLLGIMAAKLALLAGVAPQLLGLGRAFQFIRIAMLGMLSPMGLLLAAVFLLAMAYNRNFMGIADIVDNVWVKIDKFVTTVRDQFELLSSLGKYNAVEAFFRAIGFAIFDLMGMSDRGKALLDFFTMLGHAIDRFVQGPKKAIEGLTDTIKAIFDEDWDAAIAGARKMLAGIGDFFAAAPKLIGELLYSIKTGFKPLDNFLSAIGSALIDIGRLIQEVFQGDFRGAITVARRLLGNLINVFKTHFLLLAGILKAIPWGRMWDALVDQFDAINWTDLGKRAAVFISEAISAAGDQVGPIWNWISDALGDIWDSVWPAIQSGISLAWDAITDLNWAAIIPNFGNWADWIGGKIEDIGVWLWDKIKQYWPTVKMIGGQAIKDFPGWLWDKIKRYWPTGIIVRGLINDVGPWIWEKIKQYWPGSAVIVGSIKDFPGWLWDKVSDKFPIADVIAGSIGDFPGWLWGKISDKFNIPKFGEWTTYVPIVDWGEWILGKLSFPTIEEILDFFWEKAKGKFGFGGGDDDDNAQTRDYATNMESPNGGRTEPGGMYWGMGGSTGGYNSGGQNLPGGAYWGMGGMPGWSGSAYRDAYGTAQPALTPEPWSGPPMSTVNALIEGMDDVINQKPSKPGYGGGLGHNVDGGGGGGGGEFEVNRSAAAVFDIDANMGMITGKLQGLFGGSGKNIKADPKKWIAPPLNTKPMYESIAPIPTRVDKTFAQTTGFATAHALATDTGVTKSFNSMDRNVGGATRNVKLGVDRNMASTKNAASSQARSTDVMVTGAFQSLRGNVVGAVSSLPGAIESIMFAVGNRGYFAAFDAGRSIGQGLVAGLDGQLAAVNASAGRLGNAAINAMADAAEVQSPSRRAIYIAEMIGQGLIITLNRMVGPVAAAASAVGNAAIPTVGYGVAQGAPGTSSHPVNVNQFFGLTSDEYVNVLHKAEGGYAFAREMTYELTHARGGR